MKKRQEFFEKLAQDWDKEHHTEEEILRTKKFVSTYFQLNEGETVIDVGCGTGRLIPNLQSLIGVSGKLIQLDFSIEMLKIGKSRSNYENLIFIQGDGHELPVKDRSIDTVICMAFFPHLSDKPRAMRNFARVLKPGGKIIIAHQMNREELNRFHGNVEGPVSNDILPGVEHMKALFEASGFIHVEVNEGPGLYLATGKLG